MLQPFERFKPQYIKRLIELDKKYLVSQTYTRASCPTHDGKINILLSDYDDIGLAKIHYKAVIKDQYSSIICLKDPHHSTRIEQMLGVNSRYDIYWNTVKTAEGLKRKIDQQYRHHIRRYILNSTSWRIDAHQGVKAYLEVTFGELFIILKWSSQTLRIKFAEIENA